MYSTTPLQYLNDISAWVSCIQDPKQLPELIVSTAARMMRAKACSLLLVDEDGKKLQFDGASFPKNKDITKYELKIGQGIAGYVAKSGKPLLVEDVRNDPRWFTPLNSGIEFTTRSIACSPLKINSEIIGVIQIINKEDGSVFDNDDLNILNVFANVCAEAVWNARKIKDTRKLKSDDTFSNEIKIQIVGDGGAGKTSLTRRILKEEFNENEPKTHGIRILNWQLTTSNKKIKANIWDFGGQEIMHATHQFFMSKRSIYILVLDGRRDERPEYWLRHIESFGGESPIFIVLNKYDTNPSFDINRPFLEKRYPRIQGFYPISCATNHGIKKFLIVLAKKLSEAKLLRVCLSNNWMEVKHQIENLKKNYISYENFENMCIENGIKESMNRDELIELLHDLGVILHFKEFDLEEIHVLDPRWVTTAVYKIINSEYLAKNMGILKLNHLKEILSKQNESDYSYPRSKYKYIIGLMTKFELCYEMEENKLLFPTLLSVIEPDFSFDYNKSFKFVLKYDEFLPPSIMPRFIVKIHRDIKDNLSWRSGVLIENKDFETKAVVREDSVDKKINIYINGFQHKNYLAVLLQFFREINDSFENLKMSERFPIPDDNKITVSYKTLMSLAREGIEKFIPDGSEKVYSVKELLDLYKINMNENSQNLLEMLKKVEDKILDKKSFVDNANKILDLKPNFWGIGINLNELYNKFKNRKKEVKVKLLDNR